MVGKVTAVMVRVIVAVRRGSPRWVHDLRIEKVAAGALVLVRAMRVTAGRMRVVGTGMLLPIHMIGVCARMMVMVAMVVAVMVLVRWKGARTASGSCRRCRIVWMDGFGKGG